MAKFEILVLVLEALAGALLLGLLATRAIRHWRSRKK